MFPFYFVDRRICEHDRKRNETRAKISCFVEQQKALFFGLSTITTETGRSTSVQQQITLLAE